MFSYCDSWSEKRKAAEQERYRLACRLRCLESALDRIDPCDFDSHMEEIERVIDKLQTVGSECLRLQMEDVYK